MSKAGIKLISVDYKVFGKVLDVYFHSYARRTAQRHHILGYVQYASDGTVVGTIQGEPKKMDAMKRWLSTAGSPLSKVERCVFTNDRAVNAFEFNDFNLRHQIHYVFWT